MSELMRSVEDGLRIADLEQQLAEMKAALRLVPDTGFEIEWMGSRMWALSIVRFRQIEKKLEEKEKDNG